MTRQSARSQYVRLFILLLVPLAAINLAQAQPTTGSLRADLSSLIGWNLYGDPKSDTERYIPVLEHEDSFYSVCWGVEIPLRRTEDGLRWGFRKSSMENTRFVRSTEGWLLEVEDKAQGYKQNGDFQETMLLRPGKAPDGFRPPSASPQADSILDFPGFYVPSYWPAFCLEIRRVESRLEVYFYQLRSEADGKGQWAAEIERNARTERIIGSLALSIPLTKGYKGKLLYNRARMRYELQRDDSEINELGERTPTIVAWPLTRYDELPPVDMLPSAPIGIPTGK